MLLDNSMISTFKDCPRKYYWIYVRNLSLRDAIKEFKPAYGIALHAGLAEWYKSGNADKSEDAFYNSWINYEGSCDIRTLERGLVILRLYRARYKEEPFNMIATEIAGSIQLYGIVYAFRIDGLIQFPDGHFAIFETKTSARKGFLCYKPNSQVEGYAMGVGDLKGIEITEAIFNQIYFRKGRKGDKLEDTIEFTRTSIGINIFDIDAFKSDLMYYVLRIRECTAVNKFPRNSQRCLTYGRCMFLDICHMNREPSESCLNELYTTRVWDPLKGGEFNWS